MASDWPRDGGQTGKLIREYDWSTTSLGPIASWPQCLKTATDLLLRSPVPIVMLWGPDGIMIYNDAYSVFAGGRHPKLLGSKVLEGWPEVASFNANVMKVCLGGGTLAYRDQHLVLNRRGTAESVWMNLDYSPVLDENSQPAGVLAIVVETTAKVSLERQRLEIEADLRAREAELARVQEIGNVGGLEVDLTRGFRNKRSPEYLRVHGLPPSAAHETHEDWVNRIHPSERAETEAHFREAIASDATNYQAEYRIIRPIDGKTRWISATAIIEREPDGRPTRLVGAHIDVTERKEAESRQRLLMQELTHRVRNTLALVQAICSQTMRNANTIEEARDTLVARISALSQANDVLMRSSWTNAEMASLVEAVVNLHGDVSRFRIEGPSVLLGPKAALSLTLILHELATNAVKYGALSSRSAEAKVEIAWEIEQHDADRKFKLRWQESGGPPVTPPTRKGFGSRLIERSFPSSSSKTELHYPPEGVVFTFETPLEALQEKLEH